MPGDHYAGAVLLGGSLDAFRIARAQYQLSSSFRKKGPHSCLPSPEKLKVGYIAFTVRHERFT
jgi:hypothetical protein